MSATVSPPSPFSAPPDQVQSKERSGLSKVIWFGIIQLAGTVVGWVIAFYMFDTLFTSSFLSMPTNPTPAQVAAVLGPMFQYLSVALPVSVIIQLVAILVLTLGFRDFGKVDRDGFSVPSTLMLVMIAGTVVVAAGAALLFGSITNVIAAAPAAQGATPSADFLSAISSLLLDVLLLSLGGLLTLIGLIGGQILGLWRVGARYDQTVIKVGAIFVVIPLLSIVAPILVIAGAHQAKSRLSPVP